MSKANGPFPVNLGMLWLLWACFLSIHTNLHLCGNLVHRHKTVNFVVVEELNLLQGISKSTEQTEKSKKIASPEVIAHIFWSFPNGLALTIWFYNKNTVLVAQTAVNTLHFAGGFRMCDWTGITFLTYFRCLWFSLLRCNILFFVPFAALSNGVVPTRNIPRYISLHMCFCWLCLLSQKQKQVRKIY